MPKWQATIWTTRGFVTLMVRAATRTQAITKAAHIARTHRDNVGDIRGAGQ
jgi:hypothetical protein